MKKTMMLLAGAAVIMTGLTSCLGGNDENTRNVTLNTPAYALAISDRGDASISKVQVSVNYEVYSRKAVTTISGLSIGGSPVDVKTTNIPFIEGYTTIDNVMYPYDLVGGLLYDGGNVANDMPSTVTSFRMDQTRASYTNIAAVTHPIESYLKATPLVRPGNSSENVSLYAFGNFRYGTDWQVKVFWNDLLYRGKTFVNSKNTAEPYTSEDITYRVKLNLDNAGGYTADLYVYGIKYPDDKAKAVNLSFKGLPLKFGSRGYEVSVKDVVPVDLDSNAEAPDYKVARMTLGNIYNGVNMDDPIDMSGISLSGDMENGLAVAFSGTGVYLAKPVSEK